MPWMRGARRRIGWQLCAGVALATAVTLASCSSSNPPMAGGGTYDTFDGSVGACGPGHTGCPCSSEGQQAACGQVTSHEGGFVSCSEGTSTCTSGTWGPCVGEYTVFKSAGPVGGDIHTLGLSNPSTDAGACASNPCEPGCVSFGGDTSNGLDGGSGLLPTDAGGWTLPLGGGPVCMGLQCQVPSCGTGTTTAITGTVWDPAAINPVFNAVVMIPNGTVQPIPAGVSNDPCGGATLPAAVTYAYTDTSGHFTLTGVPVGASIPLVIQLGRWRRVVNINTSSLTCKPVSSATNISAASGCADPHPGLGSSSNANYIATNGCVTRLPRVESEGNIPHIAIATGGLDAIECMLYRMGVSSTEYTDELQTGRIHIFNDGGATLASPNVNHDLSYLLGFACPTGNCPASTISTSGITNASFETGSFTGWTKSGSYTSIKTNWSTDGNDSVMLGSGQWQGSCVYSGTNSVTQTGLIAPATSQSLSVDEYEFCSNNPNYVQVSLKDTTTNTTQTCQDCQWRTQTTCTLPVTPGHTYTLALTNYDQNSSGTCTESFFDNVRWNVTPPAVPSLLNNYDLVMLPCDGGGEYNSSNWGYSYDDPGRQNLVNYAGLGGRVFTSHWGREWIERTSTTFANGPFPNVATWIGDQSGNSATGVIDTSQTYGQNFDAWMKAVGATTGTTITINPEREDTSSVTTASRQFVYYQSNNDPADFTFDTPLGSSTPVGRVMFTDMHLANGTPSGTFPGNCPTQGTALTQQEDAAEYLLFDLGACVTGLPIAGPKYMPATFTRDFPATCPAGYKATWRLFSYKDLTPGNTNITFSAFTADTQAQLGTQFPAVPLITAQGANNCPVDGGAPGPSCSTSWVNVDVNPLLVSAGQTSHPYLRVNMTLNPSSDGMTAPTLIAWQQSYDCVASE